MDEPFHYPPELLQLLVDTIPRLCRSKNDVVLFFKGAGAPAAAVAAWFQKVSSDRGSVNKFEIARDVLVRLNEGGDATLRARREVLKRVVECEDFSTCWPSDTLKAKGLVAEVRRVVNVKDSFTRMQSEREAELKKHRDARDAAAAEVARKKEEAARIRDRLARLFASRDPQGRGKELEDVLNDLFRANNILVRDAFARVGELEEGVIEQIDGVIELEGHLYLAEMKWLKRTVGVGDVSSHLVRIYGRGAGRGLFISATEYSAGAISACVDALSQKVVMLCSVQEVLWVLENDKDLTLFLKKKLDAAFIDKRPNAPVLSLL